MDPNVRFQLEDDAFNRYESILNQHDIRADPRSRDTFEMLDGSKSMHSVHGVLNFRGEEFPFTIEKCGERRWLSVQVFEHGSDKGDLLMSTLNSAFPQPPRKVPWHPVPKRQWDKSRVAVSIGCFIIIAFIFAIIFFAAVGARHYFR